VVIENSHVKHLVLSAEQPEDRSACRHVFPVELASGQENRPIRIGIAARGGNSKSYGAINTPRQCFRRENPKAARRRSRNAPAEQLQVTGL